MSRHPRIALKQTTAPTVEPITVEQAKLHCRVDIADDDTLFDRFIAAARGYCEKHTKRQFITAGWTLLLDEFPRRWVPGQYRMKERAEGTDILLPRPTLQAVSSITYLDGDGVSQTVSPSDYVVSTFEEPGRIALASGATWPATLDQINAVTIVYTAGYGPARTDVPDTVLQAMLLLCSHWNENREAVLTGTVSKQIEFAVESLLSGETCTELWEGDGQ